MHKGSRVHIIIVHVGAVKISVALMEALRKKERQDETPTPLLHLFFLNNHFWLNRGLGVNHESGDFLILMIIQTFILVTIL
jgi:hypothetical protein